MTSIEILDHHVVYENPIPEIRARHAYFPGVVQLPSGDLLTLFCLAEALDAANGTTVVSRSRDEGRTWSLESPLHEKSPECQFYSDFLKPNVLSDGRLIATGYRFHRTDPEQPVANAETDGMRDGDNLVSFSDDGGRTWLTPQIIPRSCPELIEASGPSIQLRSGVILLGGSLFPMWDGSHPSGFVGVLFRSEDQGKTWDDRSRFFEDPEGRFMPSEPRFCEMQDDRVVSLVWTTDHVGGVNLANHVTVSNDGGTSWSVPIDTGVPAQASNLMYLGGDLLLTIHSHREGEAEDIGLTVRIVDFSGNQWKTISDCRIWTGAPPARIANYSGMAMSLKFGQPSLLRLNSGEILATHWAVQDGQGRILTHRLHVDT